MNEDINCNNKRFYVDYNGIITDKSYSVLVKNIEFALRTFSFNEIYFCLSSGGGNVNAGLEIYSYFKNLKNISVIMHRLFGETAPEQALVWLLAIRQPNLQIKVSCFAAQKSVWRTALTPVT